MVAASQSRPASRERAVEVRNGWVMLVVLIALLAGAVALVANGIRSEAAPLAFAGFVTLIVDAVLAFGFFTLQPNESRVLILFGDYKGTVRREGFHWGNPFYTNGPTQLGQLAAVLEAAKKGNAAAAPGGRKPSRMKVSLRARNLNGGVLKVNDKQGNPIEIAAVVVWRVQDTAQAVFDVEDYEEYVRIQSESALRHLSSQYPYDHGEEHEITLRGGTDEVSHALAAELGRRLAPAGVVIEEARLSHLAYAPEIAQAMLRRQQAEAVLAARAKIVQGAVGMVQMALEDLARRGVVDLDAERKAAMVSNLMVVLCGDSEARPVINTGTLYG
ncbi:MAG TPA: SPFH domain-containing protein [Steroidobacteraceae bacterium]